MSSQNLNWTCHKPQLVQSKNQICTTYLLATNHTYYAFMYVHYYLTWLACRRQSWAYELRKRK